MASSSASSVIAASPSADASKFDVFLSFRGEDTRLSFTDHLYKALQRAGIDTFRDNDAIDRGEELKPEIEKAIKSSRASIVVLSKNYATSAWCLDELVLILDQRKECNHFVLPVFYHVDPSDVRNQRGTFEIKVNASSKWTDQKVNVWKTALKEVADLTGMVLSGHETDFLKKIVDTVYIKLDCNEFHLPPNLTGMASRYEKITFWLNRPNIEFLAICGMGGSGKTTLAKYFYDSNRRYFENISFLENIGQDCKESNGLVKLQKQLLKDILGGSKRGIRSISQGTFKIQDALQTRKALIVLDDITEQKQLVALLGNGKINAASKIIITTRENTHNWFKSTPWRYQYYEIELLNNDESLELLSRQAFGSKVPIEDFEDLIQQAVRYCDGNPLALEVLGSSLSSENTILHWKSRLNLLDKEFNSRIHNLLLTSYLLLPNISEKELFLHIACFFVGKDKDYVVEILEPDYCALSGIKTLSNRCLLSVSPNKKLMMHRLLQEMGKSIVREESLKFPAKRSRVWLSSDSYKILREGKGSKTMEGIALDMQLLKEENVVIKPLDLNTNALKNMGKLKLLQLNFVYLNGSYENFSDDLRWLCWHGFHLTSIPFDLSMENLVAIDMSYSKLEVFDPPMVLRSLQTLDLKDSYNLIEIRNISKIPHLQTLILWNCHRLVVCEAIGDLTSLSLLNMTGCKNLLVGLEASTSSESVAKKSSVSFPRSLHRLFLEDCDLYYPQSFSVQLSLQYLNLANGLFEFLPRYNHLKHLRVLDLSLCSRLKWLLYLPSTLDELYIYYCTSLEMISFQSHKYTLQEFGYEGCKSLLEIEGFIKLVSVAKLEEKDLGHMGWLKLYQDLEVCLVGDDELTKGRSSCVQMLYEFDIRSTSLPDIYHPNMEPKYVSSSSSLSFVVPSSPKNSTLKGLDVTLRYTVSDGDCVWFCKISTGNGADRMYNPKVFGKPNSGKVGLWLSYWPIGNTLNTGDTVNVFIAVMSGLEVQECGVRLVYANDREDDETLENNMGWEETIGDLSGFQLSTGAYYLCRRDFFELMEVGRLTPDWFRILVGDTIDSTEVRGWRKTGRPKQLNPSFTELNTVRCIIHGPQSEEIYKIGEMSKLSFVDEISEFTSNMPKLKMKSEASSPRDPLGRINVTAPRSYIAQAAHRILRKVKGKESPDLEFCGEGNRYKLVEVNKDSGFRLLYNAIDTHTGDKVMIQLMEDIFKFHDDVYRTSLLHEMKLLRLLRHPDILEIKDIWLSPSRTNFKHLYVVYELMESNLHQIIEANDHLTPEHHKFILYQLLRGLKYIHTANIFLRDLKPKKIIANANCKLKIWDFHRSYNLFRPILEWGYPDPDNDRWYKAPEQFQTFSLHESQLYKRAGNIWNIGCIFAEVLIGKPLFPGKSNMNQLDLITDLLGTPSPSPETMFRLPSKDKREYLKRKKEPVPFLLKFPNADPLGLRLLERMIAFHPSDRPTAVEALSDPYFKNMANVEREPSAQPISEEFDIFNRNITEKDARELLYREFLEYHPNKLKE